MKWLKDEIVVAFIHLGMYLLSDAKFHEFTSWVAAAVVRSQLQESDQLDAQARAAYWQALDPNTPEGIERERQRIGSHKL